MLSRFPRIRLLVPLVAVFFLMMVLMRAAFYCYFLAGSDEPVAHFLQAFGIGIRFDLRMAILMVIPLGIISLLPGFLGLKGLGKWLGLLATTAAAGLMTFAYMVDFGNYSYVEQRLSSSILRFFEDGKDTYQMVWETYPVIWLTLLLVIIVVLTWLGTSRLIERFRREQVPLVKWRFALAIPLVLAAIFYGFVGKTSSTVPLRWSDAFFSDSQKVAALALNPVVFFWSTLNNQSHSYDPDLLRDSYPALARYFEVEQPSLDDFNFVRNVPARPVEGRLPNIVFIHLESLGANRQSHYGNPLGATEHLEQIEAEGLFFPNFMVPSSGTARTIFGLVTGIPDVTWGGSTATRNALISKQYTLVNAFDGYKKLYFIGGDAGWANVQGLLMNSIHDLELHQLGDYDAPAVDVWGVSDYNVFKTADARLNELPADQPFVAFIQLANNHRPFTIPQEDAKLIGFEWKDVDDATLHKYGFTDLPQYNGVRMQDRNLYHYLKELVPQGHYADNTIFLMYGDHNTRSIEPSALTNYSEPLKINNHHVPFVIYAPGIIKQPQVREQVATLMDVVPTALGFTGLPYENRTLGRDLLRWDAPGFALTFGGSRSTNPTIGLLSDQSFVSMLHDGQNPRLYLLAEPKEDVSARHPDLLTEHQQLLTGFYQAATYLLTHNAPTVEP